MAAAKLDPLIEQIFSDPNSAKSTRYVVSLFLSYGKAREPKSEKCLKSMAAHVYFPLVFAILYHHLLKEVSDGSTSASIFSKKKKPARISNTGHFLYHLSAFIDNLAEAIDSKNSAGSRQVAVPNGVDVNSGRYTAPKVGLSVLFENTRRYKLTTIYLAGIDSVSTEYVFKQNSERLTIGMLCRALIKTFATCDDALCNKSEKYSHFFTAAKQLVGQSTKDGLQKIRVVLDDWKDGFPVFLPNAVYPKHVQGGLVLSYPYRYEIGKPKQKAEYKRPAAPSAPAAEEGAAAPHSSSASMYPIAELQIAGLKAEFHEFRQIVEQFINNQQQKETTINDKTTANSSGTEDDAAKEEGGDSSANTQEDTTTAPKKKQSLLVHPTRQD
ncbi:MAG TPA: hypothetical protein VFQ26_02170 [Nitrospiraceae bacterium]|nr:hypothetical protein [Nitrospiraceae bacterium]